MIRRYNSLLESEKTTFTEVLEKFRQLVTSGRGIARGDFHTEFAEELCEKILLCTTVSIELIRLNRAEEINPGVTDSFARCITDAIDELPYAYTTVSYGLDPLVRELLRRNLYFKLANIIDESVNSSRAIAAASTATPIPQATLQVPLPNSVSSAPVRQFTSVAPRPASSVPLAPLPSLPPFGQNIPQAYAEELALATATGPQAAPYAPPPAPSASFYNTQRAHNAAANTTWTHQQAAAAQAGSSSFSAPPPPYPAAAFYAQPQYPQAQPNWTEVPRIFKYPPDPISADRLQHFEDYEKLKNADESGNPKLYSFQFYQRNSGSEKFYTLRVNGRSSYLVRLTKASRDAVIHAARRIDLGGEFLQAANGGKKEPQTCYGVITQVFVRSERGRVVMEVELDLRIPIAETLREREAAGLGNPVMGIHRVPENSERNAVDSTPSIT